MAGKMTEVDDAGLRRDRLEVLKARRQSLVDPAPEQSYSKPHVTPRAQPQNWARPELRAVEMPARPAPQPAVAAPAPAPDKSNILAGLMSGKLQAGKAARAQMMARAMQILTKTPLDADGMIAGTPFSSAGLTLLLQTVRSRAAAANGVGSKAVQMALTFLKAAPGEAVTPQGLSLAKLQMIAKRIGGAGQGAAPAPVPLRAGPAAFGAAVGGASPMQRQIMGKLHYMLTNTPADARGRVSGTGFTATGVSRLMLLLRQRAGQSGTQGGKMATRLLAELAAAPGERDVIDGASLAKLRALATRLGGAN
jgi:hypothetical protein